MKLYLIEEVAKILRVTPQSVRKLIKEGDFPQPIVIGERRHVWSEKAIEGWVEAKENMGISSNS